MSKRSVQQRKSSRKKPVNLRTVVALGDDFVLAQKTGRRAKWKSISGGLRSAETAETLVRKAGHALSKSGIDRHTIVPRSAPRGFFVYSADPGNPSRTIRKSLDGRTHAGRFVDGRFKTR